MPGAHPSLKLLLGIALALAACTPLSPPTRPDAGTDGGDLSDAGADAGGPDLDAWPCDGGPCAVETILARRVLPLDVLPLGGFVYWSEFGPDNRGIEGSMNRLPRGTTCLRDGGCGSMLAPFDLMANNAPQSLVTDGAAVCWIAYYYDQSRVYCFDTGTGAARPISIDDRYPVALAVRGGDLVWARLNAPSTAASGAIVSAPLDGGSAPQVLVGGRRQVYQVLPVGPALYWAEQRDGGSMIYSLGAGGTADALSARLGRVTGLAEVDGQLLLVDYDRGEVTLLPLDGGAEQTVSSGENHPQQVRVTAGWAFWANFGSLPDGPDGELRGVRLGSAVAPKTFASGLPSLAAFTLENGTAWWAAEGTRGGNYEDGVVQRVRVR